MKFHKAHSLSSLSFSEIRTIKIEGKMLYVSEESKFAKSTRQQFLGFFRQTIINLTQKHTEN